MKLTCADWAQEEAEQPSGSTANGGNEHLWEESWDDDDAAEDFSKQLKYVTWSLCWLDNRILKRSCCNREELKKVEASQ